MKEDLYGFPEGIESKNNSKAAVIIEGPDEVLNSNEENNPKIPDNNPPIIE